LIFLWFALGLLIAGVKFPFNWFFPGEGEKERKAVWQKDFGLYEGPRLADAWNRFWDSGRPSHDLTNIAIEWTRQWPHWGTKFMMSLFVYSNLTWVICSILF
jgi:hypothetical protein